MGFAVRKSDEWPEDFHIHEVYAEEEEEEEEESQGLTSLLERLESLPSETTHAVARSLGIVRIKWPDALLDAASLGRLCMSLDSLANQLARDQLDDRERLPTSFRQRLVHLEIVKIESGSLDVVFALLPAGWTSETLWWTVGTGLATNLAAALIVAAVKRGAQILTGDEPSTVATIKASSKALRHADAAAREFERRSAGGIKIRATETHKDGKVVRTWTIGAWTKRSVRRKRQ